MIFHPSRFYPKRHLSVAAGHIPVAFLPNMRVCIMLGVWNMTLNVI
ncbi:hypothetical protein HMPREF0454_00071 [Hafnia alvei ATCC 51873]|uniref:Uncharacterized protein n=1 Tax=Hafnia alvei ATCC 51873 TaxID=1002364 RepID=G9Y0L3_HAFAL|nr:hypothetical protein HMPREF0454_00071 [Hafnia alvei ATCC 51873]